MSTNIGSEDLFEEIPPDPLSEILPEITNDELPALLPVFEDTASEITARQLPEVYDEFGAAESLRADKVDAPLPIGRTWMWNFDDGDFYLDGNTPLRSPADEGIVIQQWIRRCLTTERFAYVIYPDWFGITMEPVWSGAINGRAAAEYLAKQIRDALIQHDRISDVQDIQVSDANGTLTARFRVLLDRGTTITVEQRILDVSNGR